MKKNKNGFTLIEVLIALAIVSIAFTAIIVTTTQTIRHTQTLQTKMMALWVGSTALNEIHAKLRPLTDTREQVTDLLGQSWATEVHLQPTSNPKIQKIIVSVFKKPEDKKIMDWIGYDYNENAT